MTHLPPPAEFCGIQQTLHDLWARTDRVVDAPAEALFAEDGRMEIGALVAEGRTAIGEYNANRRATEDVSGRRVRHFCTNLLVIAYSGAEVTLRCSLLVFQGVGEMPFASALPSNIADFVVRMRRTNSGQWLVLELRGQPIFVGPGAAANAR